MHEPINDEQAAQLIMSLAESRGDEGFTEEEAQAVLDWANGAIINFALLNGVLDGDIFTDVEEGEVVFGITEQGTDYAKSLSMGGGVRPTRVQ